MTTEILLLLSSTVLGLAYLTVATVWSTAVLGPAWNTGPRDTPPPPLPHGPARAERALQNFKETYPFFLAAVGACAWTEKFGALSWWGAQLYFWGRVAYWPLYVGGVRYARTAVWTISVLGIAMVLAQVFA